jgi:hypothetical protein
MFKFMMCCFLLLGSLSAQRPESPLFDMKVINDASTLDVKVIEDWHLVEGKVPTRQKYVTIKVGEFWPGKEYRVPVRFIVPANSKAQGFHLTGGNNLKGISKDYKPRGVDAELLQGGVGLVQTIVQVLSSWGEKELWGEIHTKFYKSLNTQHSIQYWGWPGGLMRAVTAAYAETGHFEKGKVAASGGSKNGASPSVSIIHDTRITALHATVSPISESPLRLCDDAAWDALKKYEQQKGNKKKHTFLGGTFGPIYNYSAMDVGNSWQDVKALANKVEDYVFISKNLEQLEKRKVDLYFHPGTHDFVAFDIPHTGKHYPQIPIYLRVNTGHGKKGGKHFEKGESNKTAFLLNHFFGDRKNLLKAPAVETKKQAGSLLVKVTFPQNSVAEDGRIYWMYDRAMTGSHDYLNEMFPKENTSEMKFDGKSWTVKVPMKSGAKSVDFFSNHGKEIKVNGSSSKQYISSPYTRVMLK